MFLPIRRTSTPKAECARTSAVLCAGYASRSTLVSQSDGLCPESPPASAVLASAVLNARRLRARSKRIPRKPLLELPEVSL